MAGTSRRNDEAERLKWIAAFFRVTDRAVRDWRAKNDPRYATGCVEYAKTQSPPMPPEESTSPAADDGLGDGLESEIERCRRECKTLAHRAGRLDQLKDYTSALTVHRILDAKRETLLKLERDAVSIAIAHGDVIPKVLLTNYTTDVVAALSPLAHRIATIMPPDLAPEIRERVQAEVNLLQQTCQNIAFRTE